MAVDFYFFRLLRLLPCYKKKSIWKKCCSFELQCIKVSTKKCFQRW